MKFAILNDTHCGIRGASDVMMQYQEDFYSKVFFPYLLRKGITTIIHLGDYYDVRKTINFKALEHNNKCFLDKLYEYGITMHIIPGNHDVYYKSTNSLNAIDLLMKDHEYVVIHNEPCELDFDGYKVSLIPWINNENYIEILDYIKQCKSNFIGGHFEFQGFEMMKGVMNTHGMTTELFDRFEIVVSGHFHTKSKRGNIHYLGSQMEFTWADYNDPKYFHVFDTDSRELIEVNNPIVLHHKIEYDDSKYDYNQIELSQESIKDKYVKLIVIKKKNPFMFDMFIESIKKLNPFELKIAENFDEYSGDNVESSDMMVEDTETLLSHYVELVETDLDKNKLKTIMSSLYVEALNYEAI